MLIESAEVVHYSLPFDHTYSTAKGSLSERELVMLRLRADGIEGLGEVAAMTLRGSESAGTLAAELRAVSEGQLIGMEIDQENRARNLIPLRHQRPRAELLACVDIALHDLIAKARGVPLWSLLGEGPARPVRCNGTLPMTNPTEISALARTWVAGGFDTLKLKVGVPGDLAQVRAVRDAVGNQVNLRLDANGAWRPEEAAERIAALGGSSLELVEEPTSGLEGLGLLRGLTSVRLAADESVSTEREAREAASSRACDFVALKLAKVGGIGSALEIARTCDSYMTSSLEGPVGVMAAAHVVQAMPDLGLAHGLATERLFSETVGSGGIWNGAELTLSDEPGLGVTLDEQALAARTVG